MPRWQVAVMLLTIDEVERTDVGTSILAIEIPPTLDLLIGERARGDSQFMRRHLL
ncbi:MAG: hypothetical protein SWQ30_09550 [Thermodesulfobacteriota bacterium]|nr:hypothetical protein [Thermodesulfobacteriota bacterium]